MLIYIHLLSDLAQFAQVGVCFVSAATGTGRLGFCLSTCRRVVIFVCVGVCVCVYVCAFAYVFWLVFAVFVLDLDLGALCKQGMLTEHNFYCSNFFK